MGKKLSNQHIENILAGGNLKFLGREPNRKLKVRCMSCTHERVVDQGHVLYSIKRGNTPCPVCSGLTRRTNEGIDEKVSGLNIFRMSDYVDDISPMLWKCGKCNHEWRTRATKILNENTGCPKCSYASRSKSRQLTERDIVARIEGRPIALAEGYVGPTHSKTKWKCLECNYVWQATAEKVVNEYTGCPACADVGGGKFGRRVLRDGELFDSQLEYDCYCVLLKNIDKEDIVRQHPYPHNRRMKCDFYLPKRRLWIEVSTLKTKEYLERIERKRKMITDTGDCFVFVRSPREMRSVCDHSL